MSKAHVLMLIGDCLRAASVTPRYCSLSLGTFKSRIYPLLFAEYVDVTVTRVALQPANAPRSRGDPSWRHA